MTTAFTEAAAVVELGSCGVQASVAKAVHAVATRLETETAACRSTMGASLFEACEACKGHEVGFRLPSAIRKED